MTHLNNKKQHAVLPGAKDSMQEPEFQGLEAMTDSQAVISACWVHGPSPTTAPKCPRLPRTRFPGYHTPEQLLPIKAGNQDTVQVRFAGKIKEKEGEKKPHVPIIKPSCYYRERTYNIIPSELCHGQMTYLYRSVSNEAITVLAKEIMNVYIKAS